MWQGKLIGGLVGLLAGPPGALIGAFIGHLYDVQAEQARPGDPRNVQELFFRATFQVMGHIAKADGRVSQEEIRAARAMMAQFRLAEREQRLAIELFTAGKSHEFPFEATAQRVAAACAGRMDLRLMFVQIQLQTALWSEGVNPQARTLLQRLCNVFGIAEWQLTQMEAVLRMQRQAGQAPHSAAERLDEAYRVLGVAHTVSDAEVTKAYRRLMNQNHPDKLVAKGLPESMIKLAEEKTHSIRAAYENVCEARGMR